MAPAPVRKAAAPPAAPAVQGVNFGDDSLYQGGFLLPEGDYALFFDVRNHAFTRGDGTRGQEKLGVMLTCFNLEDGSKHEQFLSMGTKAHLSFAPDPDTGKSLRAIPGAPSGTLAGSSNWNLFRQSLYDCGLPPGVFTNDFSTIDGVWVHTQNVPEPEERKNFGKGKTGEVDQPERTGPQLIPVVTEIKEDGKPWEGTGGLPDNAQTEDAAPPVPKPAAVKAAPKPVAKAAPKPVAKSVAKPAPVEETEPAGDVDALDAATAGVQAAIEKNPNGLTKIALRSAVFQYVKKTYGDDMAQTVTKTVTTNDGVMGDILGGIGYQIDGANVVAQ